MRGAPSVADGVVYVGSDDDTVHAIDAATGHELWHFTGDDLVRDYARSAPAVIGGVVYAGVGRSLYALAAPQPADARSRVIGQAAFANGVVALSQPFIGGIGRGNGTIPDKALATASLQRELASLALYAGPPACHAPVVLVVGHGDTVVAGSRLAGAAIGLLVQAAPDVLRDAAYDASGVGDAAPGQVDLYIYLSGDCVTPGPSRGTPRAGRITS